MKKKIEKQDSSLNMQWTRRGFGGGIIGGVGLLLTRAMESAGIAAHVSMKEASFYEPLDTGEREEK